MSKISIQDIYQAKVALKGIAQKTPLHLSNSLSEKYKCTVFLKREDLQVVRSYKVRGAYNRMSKLSQNEQKMGIVCASAGNHAQGVAYACHHLKVKGIVFMPETTPRQKITKVRQFGGEWVDVRLYGDTFDDAYLKAIEVGEENEMVFIHPFNDPAVITGQATLGLEILEDCEDEIDYVFLPVGGGGVVAGVGSCFKNLSPKTKIIGVEPEGAPAMKTSLEKGEVVALKSIDKFVDGAAVKKVGSLTFEIAQDVLHAMELVPEGKVCTTLLDLYSDEAMVVEPAGALSISILDKYREEIKGKTIVCLISGGNNDISRTEEIRLRSLLYEGFKHYFIIRFPQKAGALRSFLNEVLGEGDDIVHFEYIKKTNREMGPALIGIQTREKNGNTALVGRMEVQGIQYQSLNENALLFDLLL